MSAYVTCRHNFETGHRLPILAGKCQSLHGHSWWAEVTVRAPGAPTTVVEFGAFKKGLRGWIDEHLDHGLMLGIEDPLAEMLTPHGKVFTFNPDRPGPTKGLGWPTVENVALLISRVATHLLGEIPHAEGATVTECRVSETHVNAAHWRAS